MNRSVFTFATAALLAGSASADVIVQYATAGGTDSLAAFSADASVSADNLESGAGVTFQNFSTFNVRDFETDNTSFADAVADDEVFTWGFDVVDDVQINLTTLDTRWDRSGTGPDDFEIQVSVNGAAGISVLVHDFEDSSAGVNFIGVDLSAVPTLVQGDSVVFTLGAYNAESTGGSFDLETITFPGGNDSIVINGNVVPEPTSLALIGLGGLLIARRRRG